MKIVASVLIKQEDDLFHWNPYFSRNLQFPINLKRVAKKLKSVFVLSNQNSLQISRTKIKGTVLLSEKGQAYIYGCQSISQANKLAQLTVRDINRALGLNLKIIQFKTYNVKIHKKSDKNIESCTKQQNSQHQQCGGIEEMI